MDLATLIGLMSAFGIIVAAIFLGGSAGTFFNVPSLLVVCGGTVGAVLMQFSIAQFLGAMKVALKAFFNRTLADLSPAGIPLLLRELTSYQAASFSNTAGIL